MAYNIPLSILDNDVNIDNIDITRSYVYVLELEDNRYYVGRTSNLVQRMNEHFTNNGALYTKKYKPIKIKEIIEEKTCYDERDKTLEYMEIYGWENVRGYVWCRENISKKPKIKNKKNTKQIIKEYVIFDSDTVIKDMYLLETKDIIEIGTFLNKSPGSIAYSLERMGIVNRRQLCRGYFDYIFSDLYEKNKKPIMKHKITSYQEIDKLENKSEKSKLSKDELKNIKNKLHNLLNDYKN